MSNPPTMRQRALDRSKPAKESQQRGVRRQPAASRRAAATAAAAVVAAATGVSKPRHVEPAPVKRPKKRRRVAIVHLPPVVLQLSEKDVTEDMHVFVARTSKVV